MALPKWKKDRIEWARGRGRRDFVEILRQGRPPRAPREVLEVALKIVRDAWEALTGRGQDLPDDYIEEMSVSELKKRLDWYLSDEARILCLDDVLDLVADLSK